MSKTVEKTSKWQRITHCSQCDWFLNIHWWWSTNDGVCPECGEPTVKSSGKYKYIVTTSFWFSDKTEYTGIILKED